jgi:hypothetical protein
VDGYIYAVDNNGKRRALICNIWWNLYIDKMCTHDSALCSSNISCKCKHL